MSVWFTTDFESGTIGSNLDTGMLAGFDASIGATGKCTFVTGLRGSVAMQSATGATGEQRSATKFLPSLTLSNTLCVRGYVKMSTAVTHYAIQAQTVGAARAILQINSDGSVRMRSNSASLGTALGVGAINSSTPTRVEWLITATTQRVRLFTGANQHGTTPDYDSGDVAWTPAGTFDRFTIGNASGNANTTIIWDDVAADNATWIGPVVTNAAPTANAGTDQTIGLGAPFSQTGYGTDTDGTITGYTWTLDAKPGGSALTTASLTGASTATVGGTPDVTGTYTLGLVVTDNIGATSTKDQAIITVNVSDTAAGTASTLTPAPFTRVDLTGAGSGAGTWSQTSGVTAVLNGSGTNRWIKAIPSNTPGATESRTFRYTVGTAHNDVVVVTQSASLYGGSVAAPKAVEVNSL